MDQFGAVVNELKKKMQENNTGGIAVGKVISESPLQIQKDELILEEDDVLVSWYLTKQYKREAKYTWKDKDGSEGLIDREIEYLDQLKNGDKVALMPTKAGQLWIVLDKVVEYGS